jgi:4-hydroxybenzoate polyprenyltransferase
MTAEAENLPAAPPKSTRPRRKISLERVMVLFTIIFVVGIVMLVLFPEEHPARGLAMAAYSLLVFWVVFRFGI